MLILGETNEEGARCVAQRILQLVAGLKVVNEDSPHQYVTVSCGISTVLPGDDKPIKKLVKSADNAL